MVIRACVENYTRAANAETMVAYLRVQRQQKESAGYGKVINAGARSNVGWKRREGMMRRNDSGILDRKRKLG
jgi:hypothetical protein